MTCTPSKVDFCAWEAWHGRMMTLDNVNKKGIWVANKRSICYNIKRKKNLSIDYFYTVKEPEFLWELILNLGGLGNLPYCSSSSSSSRNRDQITELVKDRTSAWHCKAIPRRKRKFWKSIPRCIIWETWQLRNRIAFENEGLDFQTHKVAILSSLLMWEKNLGKICQRHL